MVAGVLDRVQHWPLSFAIRQSGWAVMAFEAAHLIGLALLGGGATVIALAAVRRDGLHGLSVAALSRGLKRTMSVGLALMAASGALIAISMPYKYYLSAAFRLKMLLLVAAILTTGVLWSAARTAPRHERLLALAAFLLWLGVGVCGRAIGFL